jgi:nitrite reductase (NADH) large subunit
MNILLRRELPASIDTDGHCLVLRDGSRVLYENLVLALGNRLYIPHIAGLPCQGVLFLESLEHARKAISKLHVIDRSVVIGKGPLSLEAVDWLKTRGVNVEFVNPSTVLLEKQVDGIASELLFYELRKRGVSMKLGAEVEAVLGNGRAAGIQLADGENRKGDLILIETRERANVDLAFEAGILVNKGVVVGERLETSAPDVYAVGRVAEFCGITFNDPDILSQQAQVLGRLLAGDPTVRYRGTISCNRFRILGFDVLSFGEFNADDEESNVLTYLDRGQLVYKKIILRDNRVVGGLFLRDTSSAEEILELARKGTDISAFRNNLLSGNLNGRVPRGKVLCSCVGVTREEILAGIKQGMNLEVLKENLRVGVNCGTCLHEVRELVKTVG